MNGKVPVIQIINLLQLPKIGRKTALKIITNADYLIETNSELIKIVKDFSLRYSLPYYSDYDFENAFQKADAICSNSERQGVKFLSFWDDDYPPLLKCIKDFPVILNYKGDIKLLTNMPTVAIIGTRKASSYGFSYGQKLARRCVEQGFNIISGLAMGCDTAGHRGALDANGITTAVLAHGLEKVYPLENKNLAAEIFEKGGLLISEYFVGTSSLPNYFVERDRIQAGLSLGTIVIETDIKGGTMHTVNNTLENNRKVACINYRIDLNKNVNDEGNKLLIRMGKAVPIFEAEDVDKFLGILKSNHNPLPHRELEIELQNYNKEEKILEDLVPTINEKIEPQPLPDLSTVRETKEQSTSLPVDALPKNEPLEVVEKLLVSREKKVKVYKNRIKEIENAIKSITNAEKDKSVTEIRMFDNIPNDITGLMEEMESMKNEVSDLKSVIANLKKEKKQLHKESGNVTEYRKSRKTNKPELGL